jgi:hypothetical protein
MRYEATYQPTGELPFEYDITISNYENMRALVLHKKPQKVDYHPLKKQTFRSAFFTSQNRLSD